MTGIDEEISNQKVKEKSGYIDMEDGYHTSQKPFFSVPSSPSLLVVVSDRLAL